VSNRDTQEQKKWATVTMTTRTQSGHPGATEPSALSGPRGFSTELITDQPA
jgi:hypothetical protein